ncbi:HK97 family phage prohead protease [Klenkia brasiliensis]|uniref:Prohead serine protease domain-containing protein n=1 Tax=Klenkia brasiliensis TaxID=333142 RepID=A0A1G7YGR3_9ACTN|nr:HK97 family phage prohead protease [Klenkia brasiliensis]SDG95445.1 hypothetical protein SAMN05660324_3945 [Klenkia brasiliensis]
MDPDTLPSSAAAAQARAAGTAQTVDRPRDRRSTSAAGSPARVRAALHGVNVREPGADDAAVLGFDGYASITETAYEMWDMFGPYTEEIAREAFDATLSRDPDVVFLLNHKGMTLARTKSGTLRLAADDTGLHVDADLDQGNSQVRDMASGLRRGDLDEMSFAFRITRGQWSPDYMSYRITELDLERGDVSVVNYGANPNTFGSLRSAEILAGLDSLGPDDLARAEAALTARRSALTAAAGVPMTAAELDAIDATARQHPLAARFSG